MWEFILGLFLFSLLLCTLIGLGYLTKAVFNIHQCSSTLTSDQYNAAQAAVAGDNKVIADLNNKITGLNDEIAAAQAAVNTANNTKPPPTNIDELNATLNKLLGTLVPYQAGLAAAINDLKYQQNLIASGISITGCNQIDLNDINQINLAKMSLVFIWMLFGVGIIAFAMFLIG